MDSTILADAVAAQDTVTQLIAAIRRAGRLVPGAAEQIAAVCTGRDYRSSGEPQIDWDDPQAKDVLVSALVNNANALLAVMEDGELDEPAASALALLALVAGQDVERAEGSDRTGGRWRITRKVAGDRVISTVDPDARHTRKSPENRRDGYRAHVVACPETGIITGEELTMAAGEENSDAAAASRLLGTGGRPAEVYGDSACGTAPASASSTRRPCAPPTPTSTARLPQRLQAEAQPATTRRRRQDPRFADNAPPSAATGWCSIQPDGIRSSPTRS